MPTFFVNTDDARISNAFLATLGAAPGSTYLAQIKAFGLVNSVNAMIAATGKTTAADLATTITGNLGLTGAAATAGQAYLTSVTLAGASSTWAANLISTLDLFTTLQNDATYGTAASAYVARINSAVAYSAVAANNSTDLTTLAAAVGSAGSTGAGSTFTLTANADGPGAIAPAVNTAGTSGNDTYTAVDTTLTSADTLDGKGGTDTLNVRAAAAATPIPVLTSIENINITNVSGAAFVLDFVSSTDTSVVASKDQTAASTTRGINMISTATARLDNADGTTEFNWLGAAGRTGTADAASIQIANGSGSAATAAVFRITTTTAGAADATFENLNIATSGAASNVTLAEGVASYRVLTVTGDAAVGATAIAGLTQGYGLSLSATAADAANTAGNLRTITASGMTGTGGLNVNASSSTQTTVAFTGSGQNDRVVISGAVANAANTLALNGGAGTNDILAISTNTDFTAAGAATLVATINAASGFEALEATAAAVTVVNADSFTSINNFIFSGAQTGGHAVSNIRTGDTLTYTVDSTRAGDTMTLSGAVAGQTLGLTLTGGVDVSASGAGNNAFTINSGITTVNLVSSNVQGLDTAGAVNTITAATTVAAIDNVSATSFVVTGAAGLTIGAVAGLAAPVGFSQAVSVNASALTGVLRVAGSTGADAIQGGTGADIIYGLGGNDEITGNAGADQFRVIATTDGTDVYKDFTQGTDKIGIIDAVNNFAGTAGTAAGATIASTDYEASRNAITDIVVGDNLKVIELQTALTSAQIAAQVSAGAASSLVLVFNSTTGKGEMWFDSTWADATADGTRVQLATFDNITTLAGVQSFVFSDFVNYVV